ncbi:prolyl oligopeptidase family serine peptidase [Flavobacterium sp. CYK-55]|uniref:carboxylesterase family protein n=1 Tax=Flavobacterium sp. CYK-55 TaxID=2835529 RepID=UPI001BD104C0|nr:prolyl oligopeptidase family serine peptidase [Flavobacterium sp. CYK-55]MBS7788157.1 prolyl oligopeptidase family serine peptidase [Flavobacterium sp. CYK-55]
MKKLLIFLALFVLDVNGFSQELSGQFQKEIKQKVALEYLIDVPNQPNKDLPLLVFLHGSGERGGALEIVKSHSPFTYKSLITQPAILLAPHCPENQKWDTRAVYELIESIVAQYQVNPKRIYLTGLSMGGLGVWKLTFEHPELFAAVAPVCAPVDYYMEDEFPRIKNVPIRIYHGALDDVVPPSYAIKIYNQLKKHNPLASLTIFQNDNHNSWDSTYSNPEFYQWLFQQHL